jgi:hypothetical protein
VLNGGSSTINYLGGNYTYSNNSGNSHYASTNLPRVRALDGVLSGSSNSGSYYIPTLNNNKRRAPICVQLKKSGTTMIASPRCPAASAGSPIDFTLADLLATMEDPTDDAVSSTLLCRGIGLTGSWTSFADYPDHAAAYGEIVAPHIGWNKTVAKLHVYAVVSYSWEIKVGASASSKIGFWAATPVVQPSGADQAAVTLGNTDGEIGGLTISDPPTQAEVQALRDKCEELADDMRALSTLVHALREALVAVGCVKGVA